MITRQMPSKTSNVLIFKVSIGKNERFPGHGQG